MAQDYGGKRKAEGGRLRAAGGMWFQTVLPIQSWRLAVSALLVLIALLVFVDTAAAHARLVSSDPASGSALDVAPAGIRLIFSEDIAEQFMQVDLLTSAGDPIAVSAPRLDQSDHRHLLVTITDPATIATGSYSLIYRVVSAVDSHATTGAVSFSVGTGLPPEQVAGAGNDSPAWWQVLGRWLEVAGWVLVAGGGFFGLFHARFLVSSGDSLPQLADIWNRAQRVGLGMAGIGLALSLWNQAILVSTGAWTDPPSLEVFRQILLETRFGLAWLSRLLLLGVILYLLLLVEERKLRVDRLSTWGILAFLGATALFSFAYAGHAAADSRFLHATGNGTVHLIAASIWLGGLPYLLLSLRQLAATEDPDSLAQASALTRRFSISSLLTVGVLVTSGMVNAQLNVSGPTALRTQYYGRALLLKQLLVAPAVISGAINLLVLRPRIRQAMAAGEYDVAKKTFRGVRGMATGELLLGAGILAVAAVLTQSPPANAPLTVSVATSPVTIDERVQAGDVSVWLLARLAGDVNDRYLIALSDASGNPPDDMQRVIVNATLAESSTGVTGISERFDAVAVEDSPGAWEFAASQLGLEGQWNLDITIRRAGVEDELAPFRVDTAGTAPKPPRLVADEWRRPEMTGEAWLFLAMSGIMLILGLAGLRSLRGLETIAGVILVLLTILIAGGFAVTAARRTTPVTAGTNMVNPVESSDIVLRQGGELFLNSCAVCHGANGRGAQGSDPLHNHGAAADLTNDRTRLQTDGDLYYRISNGVPGTEMAAHDMALTEEERWALVYHLRFLQGELD